MLTMRSASQLVIALLLSTPGVFAQAVADIFAIGCALPPAAVSSGKARDWSDVPDDQGYEAQRDAIVRHVKELLDDLQRRGK